MFNHWLCLSLAWKLHCVQGSRWARTLAHAETVNGHGLDQLPRAAVLQQSTQVTLPQEQRRNPSVAISWWLEDMQQLRADLRSADMCSPCAGMGCVLQLQGLGATVARYLARQGAKVIISARSEDKLQVHACAGS